MNLTRTNILLAVMVAGLAVPTWLTIQRDRTDFTSYEDIPKLFAGFTPGTVSGIVLGRARHDVDGEPERDQQGELEFDELRLLRSADGWVVGDGELAGVGVAENLIGEKVFDHLDRIRVDQRAVIRSAASDEELREFGLAEDQALHLVCFDQQMRPVAQLLIGSDAAGGQAGEAVVRGFYVRSGDNNDVVLYEQAYWQLGIDADEWIQRRPLQLGLDDVVGLKLTNPRGWMELSRDPNGVEWHAVQAPGEVGAVRNGEVRSFIETVGSLTVQSYVQRLPADEASRLALLAEFGLDQSRIRLTLSTAEGGVYEFTVGKQVPGANEYYMFLSSVDFVLAVGDWVTSPLQRDPTLFFDPPASRVVEEPREPVPPAEGPPKVSETPEVPETPRVPETPETVEPETVEPGTVEPGTVEPEAPVEEPEATDEPPAEDGSPAESDESAEPEAAEAPVMEDAPAGEPGDEPEESAEPVEEGARQP